MNRPVLSFLLLIPLVFFTGCAATTPHPDQMTASAKDLDRRFCDACSRGDVDGVMRTYWNDPALTVYPPGAMEWHGYSATREGFGKFLAEMPGAKFELFDSQYRVAGDTVASWGKFRMTVPMPGGKSEQMIGRYSDVKAEKNGRWVYIVDHASMPLSPPPAPVGK